MSLTGLLFTCLWTLWLASLAPQDAQPVQARRLLEDAAEVQRGSAAPSRPNSLDAEFFVTVRDGEGTLTADVRRWYTREPERIRTWKQESLTGSQQTVGFDGRRAWFRDDQSQKVVVYSDDPETFDVDLELILDQMRLTRLLLDSVVLDALLPRLSDVRMGAATTVVDPDDDRIRHPARHVSGVVPDEIYPLDPQAPPPMPDDPPRQLRLDFTVGTDKATLWALAIRPVGRPSLRPGLKQLELRFKWHKPTSSGLTVPGNITVFENGSNDESIRLGLKPHSDGSLAFDVGTPIDPRVFAVPD